MIGLLAGATTTVAAGSQAPQQWPVLLSILSGAGALLLPYTAVATAFGRGERRARRQTLTAHATDAQTLAPAAA